MNVRLSAWLLATAVAALPLTLVGCGGRSAPADATASANSTSGGSASGGAASGGAAAGSVGAAATSMDGADNAAAQSVAVFLDSLRRGDETAANAVLTTLARTEMAKTSYALQPLGTPEGQYKIGRVHFPYDDKSVALVECVWTEPVTAGSPEESMDIVCEVHQETDGWRIARLGVTMTGEMDALVLDFEDAVSLQQTIDSATGQTNSAANTVATDPAMGVVPPTSQFSPPVPSMPNGFDSSSNTQIAQPPNNGGQVLR